MQEIIQKLLANLKWRLGPRGKGFRPTKKEMAQWQIVPYPDGWLTAGWFGLMAAALLGGCGLAFEEPWAGYPLLFLAFILISSAYGWLDERLKQGAKLKAYKKKLEHNERFVLLEYAKYLQRQLKKSTRDSSLGGDAERKRIEGIINRLNLLLKEGAGRNDWTMIPSKLAQEADAAEALVESYEGLDSRDIVELDERLPGELRSRLEELENTDLPTQQE